MQGVTVKNTALA